MGGSTDNDSYIQLVATDVDSCESIYFRSSNMDLDDVEIYNNSILINNQCGEMSKEPTKNAIMLVHDCNEGIHFRETLKIDEYIAQDNTNYDLAILEGDTVTIVNGTFDETKIKRVT